MVDHLPFCDVYLSLKSLDASVLYLCIRLYCLYKQSNRKSQTSKGLTVES